MGDSISHIQMALGVQQIGLQQRTLDELDTLKRIVESCTHTSSSSSAITATNENNKLQDAAVLQISRDDMEKLATTCQIPINEIAGTRLN